MSATKTLPDDIHSKAWYYEMRRYNPSLAMHTAHLHLRVFADKKAGERGKLGLFCSICGDGPAPAYWLSNPPRGPAPSIRLCRDCLNIRREQFGEIFIPEA